MYVVSEVSVDDGLGGQARKTYAYGGAKVDVHGRGFLGFRWMELKDEQTGIFTTTEYRQDFPFIGQVDYSETYLDGGATLKTLDNTWSALSLNDGDTQFPYVSASTTESYELNDGAGNSPVTTVSTTTDYDIWGNPTSVTVQTSGAGNTFTTVTTNTYTNDTDTWFLGRLTRAEVARAAPGQQTETRVSSFVYDAATGLLTREVIEPDIPALTLTTDYTYDAFGNKATVTVSGADIATRTTTTTYDTEGRFPISATNALGHSETRTFDARFGTVTSLTGPNNLTTMWSYDGFGRKTLEDRADGTDTVWSYDLCTTQCPTDGIYAITEQSTGQPVRMVSLDALNREIRSESEDFDGTPIYTDTEYDALGRVKKTSRPYYAGDTPLWTTFTYDFTGRALTETGPDGSVITRTYAGLSSTTTDPLGHATTRVNDAAGKLASVTDDQSGTTTYTYDSFGNLLSTMDALGNVVSMSYDIRGQKIAMSDPDMGNWSYGYNVLGELVSQTDAKAQTVTLVYDKLGRMTSRTEPEGTTTWTYDTSPVKGIGKLHQVQAPNGFLEVRTYDALGRPSATATTITMETFTVTTTYDSASRIAGITYPTGFGVTHTYSASGHLMEVRDAATSNLFWEAVDRDAEGHVIEEFFGNGLTTLRDYDPETGRVQSIVTDDGLSNTVQDLSYVFDLAGNLTYRKDLRQSVSEQFTYDSLNRLSGSELIDTSTSTTLSTKSYAYDAVGNTTSKSDVGAYIYGEGSAGPHAVTSAGGNTYAYDANGNMTSGAGRTLAWSSFNKPTSITGTTSTSNFLYGPDRRRVQHVLTTGTLAKTIKYVGAIYEQITETGQPEEHRHYVTAGERVAYYITRSDETTATRYLHKDHLGSADAITGESGVVVERLSYEPHGKRRQPDWQDAALPVVSLETPRGFTGHEHLEDLELVHMNGRVYDPTLGRFLSADPYVQFPDSTQGLNRYSYVYNNPLSLTDPTGFFLGSIIKAVKKVVKAVVSVVESALDNPYIRTAAAIAITVAAPHIAPATPAWAVGATSGFVASGGEVKGAIIGAVAATAFNYVGTYFEEAATVSSAGEVTAAQLTPGQQLAKVVAHGVVGGAAAETAGGDFLSGFVSAGAVQGFQQMGGFDSLGLNTGAGDFGGLVRNAVTSAAIGGTASVLGGGKFANGAVTGAFSYLFANPGTPTSRYDANGILREEYWGEIFATSPRVAGLLPGTGHGESAAQYWADIAINSDHPLAPLADVPGTFASLWTPDTARSTALTLVPVGAGAGAARALAVEINFFSQGNVFKIISKTLQRGFRVDPAHHGKPWGHTHRWRWGRNKDGQ